MSPEGLSLDTGVDFAARLDDPWVRHPMVQLRETLPAGTPFDEVIQIEGRDWRRGSYQELRTREVEESSAEPVPPSLGTVGLTEVDEGLEEALAEGMAVPVVIWLRVDEAWDDASVTHRIEHGLFEGTIYDEPTWRQAREGALEDRPEVSRQVVEQWLAGRPSLEVLERGGFTPSVTLWLNADQVALLRGDPVVVSMHLAESSGGEEAWGRQYLDELGMRDFHDSGYEGHSTADAVGMIEGSVPHPQHPGFARTTVASSRVHTYECTNLGFPAACEVDTRASIFGEHPTAVAGILMGDITRGQDDGLFEAWQQTSEAGWLPDADQVNVFDEHEVDRSGIASQSELYSYAISGSFSSASAMVNALSHMRTLHRNIPVVNMSYHLEGNHPLNPSVPDPACSETHYADRAVNAFYEDGGLVFKSAGNAGNRLVYSSRGFPVPDCTVTRPGGALSSMTIAAVNDTYVSTDDPERRRAGDSSYSDPEGRSMVKLAAFRDRYAPYRIMGPGGWDTASYGPSPEDEGLGEDWAPMDDDLVDHWGGTSFSAPAVAGSAMVLRRWMMTNGSAFVDEPGLLAAALLNMGDRYAGDGARLDEGFDAELGAGFLRAELFDSAHQTAPWGVEYAKGCLADGSTSADVAALIPVNQGNRVELDVRHLQASLWWYDVDHDEGGALSDFDLYLEKRHPMFNVWYVVASSTSDRDNMERVHFAIQPGSADLGARYRWRIQTRGLVPRDHI
ncbi:MAG: S8 family serine peptidase, partial [Deltaproteobacteria bacterium]|nr:S8 family serine peptidase [Deltaproteobacteria bacterium]